MAPLGTANEPRNAGSALDLGNLSLRAVLQLGDQKRPSVHPFLSRYLNFLSLSLSLSDPKILKLYMNQYKNSKSNVHVDVFKCIADDT